MSTNKMIRKDLYPTRKESETFASRLEFVLKIAANNDVGYFAEMSDISTSALRSYLRGDTDPSMSKITSIVLCSGVQLDWMILGKGPVYCETTTIPILTLKEASNTIQNNTDINIYTRERRNMIDNVQIRPDVLSEQFGLNPHEVLVAQHEGYTMASTLNQGDWLLLDRVNTRPNHGMYLIAFSDSYDIRRLIRHPNGTLSVTCDNERYADFSLTEKEFQEGTIQVLAKVRHSWNARDL